MLYPVAPHDLDEALVYAMPLLKKAISYAGGIYTADSVVSMLREKDWQLWLWMKDGEVLSAATTAIFSYPSGVKRCTVTLVGGTGNKLKNWLSCQDEIAQWAKSLGCVEMECCARPGWARILKNWRATHTVLIRSI